MDPRRRGHGRTALILTEVLRPGQEETGQRAEVRLVSESTGDGRLVMLMLAAVATNEQATYYSLFCFQIIDDFGFGSGSGSGSSICPVFQRLDGSMSVPSSLFPRTRPSNLHTPCFALWIPCAGTHTLFLFKGQTKNIHE